MIDSSWAFREAEVVRSLLHWALHNIMEHNMAQEKKTLYL